MCLVESYKNAIIIYQGGGYVYEDSKIQWVYTFITIYPDS